MSKITEQLYIGSITEASDKKWLDDHFITHIVNCAVEIKNFFPNKYNYLRLDLYDSPEQSLYQTFEPTHKFIKNAIGNGGTILVHCYAGVSRSSSIILYFLMKIKGWNYREALKYTKSKHSKTNPNFGFARQLVSVSPEAKLALPPVPIQSLPREQHVLNKPRNTQYAQVNSLTIDPKLQGYGMYNG
uniref:protein-serine/threonine phosphatase n=1 Tax=Marseillevirus LCMAC102 TaxID=2506603 RepID=A0A481YUE2_9VIRU|nr:MAG: dual specificity phosphatase [Marseillevirus LCMAC102]